MSLVVTDTNWAVHEFADADLGDERRTTRLVELANVLGQHPTAALPEACGNGGMLKAAYRFFDNDDIAPQDILQSHVESTYTRLGAVPVVLAVQDTTEVNWTQAPGHPRVGAFGPYGLPRAVGPYDLSDHARARALGALGPTGVGPGPRRRGQTRPAQAPAHQPERKSEVAPQSRRRVHRP